MDAELDASSVDDVNQCENRIVSQWRKLSADEQNELRGRVDEIFRPFGLETSLVVLEVSHSIALFFICMSLSALMSLRDQWSTGHLRHIVQSLFTLLSGDPAVRLKRLAWPLSDFERCLTFFSYVQGKQTVLSRINVKTCSLHTQCWERSLVN